MNKLLIDALNKLYLWEKSGCKTLPNGTRLICHVPHVGTEAWLHEIYHGLQEDTISELEHRINKKFPEEFNELLKYMNGINIFSDSLSIWGYRSSYVRIGDESIQPYDLVDLNKEREELIPENWLLFGSYSWDGSIMVLDLNRTSKRVIRVDRDTNKVYNEWTDLFSWFSSEVDRLSVIFDDLGKKIHEDSPTIPN
jgi:hypothetical protein